MKTEKEKPALLDEETIEQIENILEVESTDIHYAHAQQYLKVLYDIVYPTIKCPHCEGEGTECGNPDHGFIDMLDGAGHDFGRIGCPGCGHEYLNGDVCKTCNGKGKIPVPVSERAVEERAIGFVESNAAQEFGEFLKSKYRPDDEGFWIDWNGNPYTTAELFSIFLAQTSK